MRGGCQAAAELNREGGGCEAGEDEQGDPWRAASGGQLARDSDSRGNSTGAVCDQPQEMAQPSSRRGWWWRGHGPPFLLLKLKSKVNKVQVTFTLDFQIILPRSPISLACRVHSLEIGVNLELLQPSKVLKPRLTKH